MWVVGGLDACGGQLVCVCPLTDRCSQVWTFIPSVHQTEAVKEAFNRCYDSN